MHGLYLNPKLYHMREVTSERVAAHQSQTQLRAGSVTQVPLFVYLQAITHITLELLSSHGRFFLLCVAPLVSLI